MKLKFAVLSVAAAVTLLTAPVAHAKPFKWTSASDIPTLDVHSQNNALGNGVHAAIYDSLVYYNSRTFKPEPLLATGWKELSPTQLRFTLRAGVKFSDGSPFTADDVVFSIHRAMSKTSNYAVYTTSLRSFTRPSRRKPPASPRCSPARSTSCSIPARRTWRGCARMPT